MGLLDVVEPEGWQVEHLTGLHGAAKGPGLTVTGVPGQIWCQWVQWDPGYLGTQQMPGRRPKAPRPSSSVPSKGKHHEPCPVQHLGIFQSQVSPALLCLLLREQAPTLPPPQGPGTKQTPSPWPLHPPSQRSHLQLAGRLPVYTALEPETGMGALKWPAASQFLPLAPNAMETLRPHRWPGASARPGSSLPSLYLGPPALQPLQAEPHTIGDEGPVAGWM